MLIDQISVLLVHCFITTALIEGEPHLSIDDFNVYDIEACIEKVRLAHMSRAVESKW